jgi:hypothetical protein
MMMLWLLISYTGLSVNDNLSCLWGCPGKLSKPNANRSGCDLLPGREYGLSGSNLAGSWSEPLDPFGGSCAIGQTSEEGGALTQDGCLDCPTLSLGAARIANSKGNCNCEWNCMLGQQLGGACFSKVTIPALCIRPGLTFTQYQGICVSTSHPWNRPGFSKVYNGWLRIVSATPGLAIQALLH